MKKIILMVLFAFFALHSQAQYQPYLTVDYRNNIIGQVIDIYDGPQKLSKVQVLELMESDPDVNDLYRAALRKQRVAFGLDIASTAILIGSTVYIFAPSSQSRPNNLYLPLVISSLGVGIASGFYRRSARNLTRQAVDMYNFGAPKSQPSHYFEGNIPQTKIFSYRFYFQ